MLSLRLPHTARRASDARISCGRFLRSRDRTGPPPGLLPEPDAQEHNEGAQPLGRRQRLPQDDRLEAIGLVERHRNPEDGRGLLIGLTDAGHALIEKAVTEHVANQHRLTAALSDAERAALDTLLAKWLAAFEDDGPAAS